uniref:Reverse transcriptase domain-containing protein n=1 Tax=Tanacetum cinerariifolium TaxID=118510 RepID=A0A6L2J9G4_TANCI|nr:reverse transcriptase domain-containing protein [Tanacetum cinerariifolium]
MLRTASISGVSPDVAELKDMVRALLLDKKGQSLALVKAVEESCVTCGGAHSYRNCPATDGNNYRDNIQEFVSQASAVNFNQGNTSYRPPMMSNQIRPPGFPLVPNNQNLQRNNQNRFIPNQNRGTLPSNMIANPRSDLKAITTRSGVSYNGPQIPHPPSSLPKVVEDEPEVTKDTLIPINNKNTKDIQPQAVQSESPILTSKPITSLISEPAIAPIFKDMSFEISFADALILMPKFASTLKALIENKEKLSEMARTPLNEHCSAILLKKLPEKLGDPSKFLIPCDFRGMAECLALADLGASINLMPFSVWKRLSLPDLTPTFVDFDTDPRVPLILERSFLKTERALIDVFEEGDILRLEAFLNDDPSLPPPNQRNYLPKVRKELKIYEAYSEKSSVDEPPVAELKELPPYLEYGFLEGDDKLPVIIAKDLSVEEKTAFMTVLKSYKRAIACKISDINGGFTVVENEDNELIPTGLVTGWRVCIDYRKLNEATRKDHFPLPFSGYFQIPIDPKDQEKTTFTCPYETFAYFRMPFGLSNAPGTFQRCMMTIFHDMIEKTMDVFMDDFSVFRDSFQSCLSYLDQMLKRCEDTNLCLNWEKCHFMVMKCVDAFRTLKIKLCEAPILIALNWDIPFELMCDASDFAIGAVLGAVGENRASWSDKLDDALWAFRTAYKTPIRCTPYNLVYGKACHLPVKLEHKAYWALKHANFDLKTVGDHRKETAKKIKGSDDTGYKAKEMKGFDEVAGLLTEEAQLAHYTGKNLYK